MANLVTSEEASELLGVSRETVRNMVKDGRLIPTALVNDRIAVFDTDYLRAVKPRLVIHFKGTRRNQKVEVA